MISTMVIYNHLDAFNHFFMTADTRPESVLPANRIKYQNDGTRFIVS
jgi:hypothetical protein